MVRAEPVTGQPPVQACGRPRGRPRSAEADRAITAAAIDVLADDGVDSFCVEAVAARAAVSKATIYRRFASRESLLAESLATLNDDLPPVPDTGSLRDDLVAMLGSWRERHDRSPAGRVMPRMIGTAPTHPDLFAVYHQRVVEPRRARFCEVMDRGATRGEVRPDVDVDLAVDLVVGPMVMWLTAPVPGSGPITDVSLEALVDVVLAGLAPR